MMKFAFASVFLSACLFCNVSWGLVGDQAPALNVEEWAKGGPYQVGPGTNIYVIEIWHTIMPNLAVNVTNLNAIQREFGSNGVVVVAVSDEGVPAAEKFVKREGANINFAVAADHKRFTSLTYMKPVGERTIPYAFIVGTNGDLWWHGHPGRLGVVLQTIVDGRYDESEARKWDVAKHQMEQYMTLVRQGSDRAKMAGERLLAARTNDLALLCDLAFVISTHPAFADNNRDFGLANRALDQAAKLAPTNSIAVGVGRAFVLFSSGKHDEALSMATQMLHEAPTPADRTNVQMCIEMMQARMAGKSDAMPRRAGDDGAGTGASQPANRP